MTQTSEDLIAAAEPTYSGLSATYCPEDNKLRLTSATRLSKELYARVKAAGFRWAPKQEIFVAPAWTPDREDLLVELCGEIEDEDYSPEERAADRAERFAEYRGKRVNEADAHADRYDAGPAAFGHQNRQRAERQAARHERVRDRAVDQWSKAEYWQRRTAAVIAHATYKTSPELRRGRIERLETERRPLVERLERYNSRHALWQSVATTAGAGEPVTDDTPAGKLVRVLLNRDLPSPKTTHPRTGNVRTLDDHSRDVDNKLTAAEVAELWLGACSPPDNPRAGTNRWLAHYELRLQYERAMLANEGGMASELDMVPGGWIGGRQILRVFKSPATKRVTSVDLEPTPAERERAVARILKRGRGKVGGIKAEVTRLGTDAYRPPTAAELAEFNARMAAAKKEEQAVIPKAPPLLNPSAEEAQKLQDLWNDRLRRKHGKAKAENRVSEAFKPTSVVEMTQAAYARNSKGEYARAGTVEITAEGTVVPRYGADAKPVAVFRVRKATTGAFSFYAADAVIRLTDKPTHSLPLDWAALSSDPGTAE